MLGPPSSGGHTNKLWGNGKDHLAPAGTAPMVRLCVHPSQRFRSSARELLLILPAEVAERAQHGIGGRLPQSA